MYRSALKASGYNLEILYTEKTVAKKRCQRFNPPRYDEVSTNVAKKFPAMIEWHFLKGSAFGKHFNRNTVKFSYSSMPNMARIISGHNKMVTGSSTHMETKGCNYRSQPCPLKGKCKTTNLVYRSTVEAAGTTKQYLWLTSNTWKERFTGHKASFTRRKLAQKPTLSSNWDKVFPC